MAGSREPTSKATVRRGHVLAGEGESSAAWQSKAKAWGVAGPLQVLALVGAHCVRLQSLLLAGSDLITDAGE